MEGDDDGDGDDGEVDAEAEPGEEGCWWWEDGLVAGGWMGDCWEGKGEGEKVNEKGGKRRGYSVRWRSDRGRRSRCSRRVGARRWGGGGRGSRRLCF